MIGIATRAVALCGIALWLLAGFPVFAQPSNGVYREAYLNIGGSAISDLTNNPAFPNSPTLDDLVTNYFEGPINWTETYGQRMRALVKAPTTGSYTFWISSDDAGELWLSTDSTPANRRRVAHVASWTGSRDWTKEQNQVSAPVTLTAGQSYYIEALMKEGGGGDNVAVRWQLPGGAWENPADANLPIPASRLTPYGLASPVLAQQPASVSVVEGGIAQFGVRVVRSAGVVYQWQRGAVDIPGATLTNLVLGPVTLADDGLIFRCRVSNWIGVTNTTNAVLRVLRDMTRPVIASVGNLGDPEVLTIVFSESVEADSATNAANYAINLGIEVLTAVFGPDDRTVLLTTTPMSPNVTYTLTVNNVRDKASTPNTIAADSSRPFNITPTPLLIGYLKPSPEPMGPSTRRGPLVISELMYHPTNRPDGRDLEFIEIYNTLPWAEELGGFKITGEVNYTFPSNATISPRAYLVVAKNPADLQAARGINNVLGPWEGSLGNGSGSVQLRNAQGAILFDMEYSGDAPWPLAADGAGHSLVLARPSFGERDTRSWAASDIAGGTPGTAEIIGANAYAPVMINEFFANSDPPDADYIELYNYSNSSIDLAGCTLSDDPATNKFVIPANTVIGPRGFVVFNETNLGFALSASGEGIYFRNPQRTRMLDAIRFGGQQGGVSSGRSPDGAASFSRLQTRTPGTNNSSVRAVEVVINEIMYHPISENDEDAYIELHNTTSNTLDVSRWRIDEGVTFTMPPGTIIPGFGYLVVARNAARLRAQYPALQEGNCIGDWDGSLRASGERVALSAVSWVFSTNSSGVVSSNLTRHIVDEVTYRDGGRWGRWSDGGGSSLELRDWRSDRRLAPNWSDSDESGRSTWVNVEATGPMVHGYADAYQLHVTMLGEGECLLDNVEVITSGGANLVQNGTFENGAGGWVFQGNHNETSLEEGSGYNSSRSLHLRATGRGDTGANRVRTQLASTPGNGTTVTLRARARWLKGSPHILLRMRGNWHEAFATTVSPGGYGTPGVRNSAATTNAPPAITDVAHWPALPAAGQSVFVSARISDPDGLATALLKYRVEPSTNFSTVTMANNGAGLYSATIPAQSTNGSMVEFHVVTSDKAAAVSSFPSDAPVRECVVIWGDTVSPGTLPTYRFWISRRNVQRWSEEEKMSNNPKDVTFIYGTNRVVYNAGAWFHGSPYHSPSYNSPVGNSCDYDLRFPADDRLMGERDINLFRPGNGGSEGSGQREIQAHWWGRQFGVPHLFHRPVFVLVNGQRREVIYHDAQQPNGDFMDQWFSQQGGGELHKVQLGFEFGDQAYGASEQGYAAAGAQLARFMTPSGAYHLPRYRQTLPLRAAPVFDQNNYTNLFALVEAVLTNVSLNTPAYTAALTNATDVEEWFRVHVLQHLWENWDSFSYGGSQNAFICKPVGSPWKLLLWDVDFAFGNTGNSTELFNIGGADHGPRNDHAPFRRIYWQALHQAADSFLAASRSSPMLDARYNGLVAAGAAVSNPSDIKTFIANKRAVVLAELATVPAVFAITSNSGNDFSAANNLVNLSGTAPIGVRTIEVNGIVVTPAWSSITNWTISLALTGGVNTLSVVGRDYLGNVVNGATQSINVTVTAPPVLPQDAVVISEIMHDPKVPGAEYIEIYNRSASYSFDVSRWRLDGVDYRFPDHAIIQPRRYLLLARDANAFASVYGTGVPVFGVYDGNLQGNGETITLLQPGVAGIEVVVDKVRYDNALPWPAASRGTGSSLQLIDAAQDHARVGNWGARHDPGLIIDPVYTPARTNDGWSFVSISGAIGVDNRLLLFLDNAGTVLLDDISLVAGPEPAVGQNYVENGGFESPLDTNIWTFGTNMLESSIVSGGRSGATALRLVQNSPGARAVLSRDLVQRLTSKPPNGQVCTLSFWYHATNTTATNLVMRIVASSMDVTTNIGVIFIPSTYIPGSVVGETNYATPGAGNSFAATLPAFPNLWINELQSENLTGPLDSAGEHDPWIEIYNPGTNNVSLNGLYLANNYTNLTQWAFPTGIVVAPKEFKLLFIDGQEVQSTPSEIHAGFRLSPDRGSLALSRLWNGATQVVDYVNYNLGLDHSYGSFPDGQPFQRQEFYHLTPGATNNGTLPSIVVSINEVLADNTSTLADPADDNFEDWFEIYNPGTNSVSLAGYYFTDSLTNKFKYQIPAGYSVPPGGYLLVWADGETGQNSPSRSDLHVNFSLAKSGEAVGLFTPDGVQIDAIVFGAQTSDVGYGRFPDGSGVLYSLTNTTPRSSNVLPLPNTAPDIVPIPDQTIIEGGLFGLTPAPFDGDVPAQQFTWELLDGSPVGATINSASGAIVWQTEEAHGGAAHSFTLRVTDSGEPPLSATQTFLVTVLKTNSAPVMSPISNRTVEAGTTITFTAEAMDFDGPVQGLTFSLDAGAPSGASIDPGLGIFSWTPTWSDAPGAYNITVRVIDDATPQMSDSATFTVTVNAPVTDNLRLDPITWSNGVVRLSWQTAPGRTYRVEYTTNLNMPGWLDLGTNVMSEETNATIIDYMEPGTHRLYRIVTP